MRRLVLLLLLALAALTGAWRYWRGLPLANTGQPRFDAILVLGSPCRSDGSPTPEQRERTLAGVRAWRAGRAPFLVVSGGAARNRWVEADSMARIARQAGVPTGVVLEERRALNTVENVGYTYALMRQHGWHSLDVVSSPSHLPRAGLILARFPIAWRTEAAPWPPEFWPTTRWAHQAVEAEYSLRLRWFGFPRAQARELPTSSTAPPPPSAPPNP